MTARRDSHLQCRGECKSLGPRHAPPRGRIFLLPLTQIIIMYLLGQRERTVPKGKRDFVVWEGRALLPVLISAYGCDVNIKQDIKRQCSEIALDPCLPLHRQAPSPVDSFPSYALKAAKTEARCLSGAWFPWAMSLLWSELRQRNTSFWGQVTLPMSCAMRLPF